MLLVHGQGAQYNKYRLYRSKRVSFTVNGKLPEQKIARTENCQNRKLPETSRIFLNVTVGGDK